MVETLLMMILICLVFCGIYQVSLLFSAKEVLDYSAGRAARAKTVGFNEWMVLKSGKVAAIPNAGKMITPSYTNIDLVLEDKVATLSSGGLWDWVLGESNPRSAQYAIERARIPEFLESANDYRAYFTLNYTNWGSIDVEVLSIGSILYARSAQRYPLTIPMHRSFYDADEIDLVGESCLEKHYDLYLDDMGW